MFQGNQFIMQSVTYRSYWNNRPPLQCFWETSKWIVITSSRINVTTRKPNCTHHWQSPIAKSRIVVNTINIYRWKALVTKFSFLLLLHMPLWFISKEKTMTYPKCAMELVWLYWKLQKDTVDIIFVFCDFGQKTKRLDAVWVDAYRSGISKAWIGP